MGDAFSVPFILSCLVLIYPTWSCMSYHKLLLRHLHYLNQSRSYLVAVCPVSCLLGNTINAKI